MQRALFLVQMLVVQRHALETVEKHVVDLPA
jgi:hypothetical protein